MQLSCGGASYAWLEEWAAPSLAVAGAATWAHHDLAATADGRIVGFQSGSGHVCLLDRDGRLLERWPTGLVEGHGLTLAGPPGEERLWIADPGLELVSNAAGAYDLRLAEPHGQVVAFDLRGRRLAALPTPGLPAYAADPYRPTAVAIDNGPDADGSIWVADGYGQSLVHRFSRTGELELTLTGEEGAGRFDCPHALLIDRRAARPRLYVTDRGNARLAVYDLDGGFLGTVFDGLRSPTALAVHGDRLIVAELDARLAVLDRNDRPVGYLGRDDCAPAREGWPNAVADDGRHVRPPELRPGSFNSPHGLAVDAGGDLYVSEWVVGGRLICLRRQRTVPEA
ncbi:MAG: hypothetical protein WBC33_00390 [Conexibacter sp.]